MYNGEEEECSILEIFSLEKKNAKLIADKYIKDFLQEDVYWFELS